MGQDLDEGPPGKSPGVAGSGASNLLGRAFLAESVSGQTYFLACSGMTENKLSFG